MAGRIVFNRWLSRDLEGLVRQGTPLHLGGVRCQSQAVSESLPTPQGLHRNILKSVFPDICLPDLPLHSYIWEKVPRWPDHTAIECAVTGKKYSYSELQTKSMKFGASLSKLGLRQGDMLAIILPNIPEYPLVYLGALQIGLIATTVNPLYTKEEMTHQLHDTGVSWVVCHPSNLFNVLAARNQIKRDITIICTADLDGSTSQAFNSGADNVILFDQLISDSVQARDCPECDIEMSSTALIAYSSGTTGLPKGTCLTHYSLTANMAQFATPPVQKFVQTHGSHQDTVPGFLPFFHMYGNAGVLLSSLNNGSKVISMPTFDPQCYLSILEKNSNLLLFLVAPIVFLLGNRPEVGEKHLRGVREILSAAAPCSKHDLEKVTNKTPNKIFLSQAYGLTETSPIATVSLPAEGDDVSTVGRLVSNTWGKVVNPETGEILPPNTPGELCFKGPQLMKCYLNNPQATRETIDPEGWLHSGDIGYYDEQGLFYITDRLKELIKVSGFQVAPAELEEVLRQYPGVLEAGVVGVPHSKTGETPVAFVQSEPGTEQCAQEVIDFVSSRLANYKRLSSVTFIDSIPKTPSGKILRKNLKKLAMSRQ